MKKNYIVTVPELAAYTARVYKNLTEVSNICTESTSMTDVFSAMAVPSQLVCHISNGSVYPASSGTLAMNKIGNDTGTATFMDAAGRVSTGVFPWSDWQSPGYSNPNLLINWDFRNPVNQRGQSAYTGDEHTGYEYTIDMWKSISNGGSKTVTMTSEGLRLSHEGSGLFDFIQSIEHVVEGCVTFSAKIDGQIYSVTFALNGLGATTFGPIQFYSDNKNCVLRISNKTVDIQAVKLEVGTVSTLALDLRQPSDYAAELRKCQQYLQVIENTSGSSMFIGGGSRSSATNITCLLDLECRMRKIPTASIEDLNKISIASGDSKNIIAHPTSISHRNFSGLRFGINMVVDASEIPYGTFCPSYLETGGKIVLSAEL